MAHDMWKILSLLCFCFFAVKCHSFLNIEELTSTQYGIEITNTPVLLRSSPDENHMYVSSKHGQTYSCFLPEVISTGEENSEDKDLKLDQVTKLLDTSFNGSCLTLNKGWWTYRVCHKKNIEQYHINENGKIDGGKTLLGVYESEENWSTKENVKEHSGTLYHTQKYVNGDVCDLTAKPRKATVQYSCSDQKQDSILRVEEPSTCEYIITIHSHKLCTHPLFKIKEKSKQVELVCNPALNKKQYEKYTEKLERKKAKEEEANRKALEEEIKKKAELSSERDESNEDKNKNGMKNIWQDAANEANKFMKDFMKTWDFDKDTNGIAMNIFGDMTGEGKRATTAEDTGADKKTDLKKDLVNQFLELDAKNEQLENEARNTHKILSKEYNDILQKVYKELDRSTKFLRSVKKMHSTADNDKEKREAQNMIESLEKNIDSLQKQAKKKELHKTLTSKIRRVEKQMASVQKFEQQANQKLFNLDEKINPEKITKVVNKIMNKKQNKEVEKDIADSVADVFKAFNMGKDIAMKENIAQKMKEVQDIFKINKNKDDDDEGDAEISEDRIHKAKSPSHAENLQNGKTMEGDENMISSEESSKLNADTDTNLDSELDDYIKTNQKSFDDSMEMIRDFLNTDLPKTNDDSPKTKPKKNAADKEHSAGSKDSNSDEGEVKELKNQKFDSLDDLVSILKKQIDSLNKKDAVKKKDDGDNGDDDGDNINKDVDGIKGLDDVQVRVRTIDDQKLAELDEGLDNLDEDIRDDIKSAAQQMEEAVKKQLKEAGVDLQKDVKIKIITMKDDLPHSKSGKLLSDSEADGFKDMLMGFLGGGQEKAREQKRNEELESNYNFVFDDNDDDTNNGFDDFTDNNNEEKSKEKENIEM